MIIENLATAVFGLFNQHLLQFPEAAEIDWDESPEDAYALGMTPCRKNVWMMGEYYEYVDGSAVHPYSDGNTFLFYGRNEIQVVCYRPEA